LSLPFVGLRIRRFYFGGGQTLYQHGKTLKRLDQFDEILKTYKGDIPLLEKALGAYFVGRRVGWKVMYVLHDVKTIRKYEQILKINFREEFKDYEDLAHRTRAYQAIQLISNFWKAIKGETPGFEKSPLMGK